MNYLDMLNEQYSFLEKEYGRKMDLPGGEEVEKELCACGWEWKENCPSLCEDGAITLQEREWDQAQAVANLQTLITPP
jgi:hypothetical protein